MTDHEAIEELLAGYSLRSLSGSDAREAAVVLEGHVPTCDTCRELLHDLGVVTADLSLAATPIEPPQTLLPRLYRSMEPRAGGAGRASAWTSGRLVAAAAGLVLVVGLAGLALRAGDGASLTQGTSADLQEALRLAEGGSARTTDLGPATEVVVPGNEEFYVVGRDVPAPPPGSVYRLWLVSETATIHAGDFTPAADGSVVLLVRANPSTFDHVLVTVEPADTEAGEPGEDAWDDAA